MLSRMWSQFSVATQNLHNVINLLKLFETEKIVKTNFNLITKIYQIMILFIQEIIQLIKCIFELASVLSSWDFFFLVHERLNCRRIWSSGLGGQQNLFVDEVPEKDQHVHARRHVNSNFTRRRHSPRDWARGGCLKRRQMGRRDLFFPHQWPAHFYFNLYF